jgi:hypothetical protein
MPQRYKNYAILKKARVGKAKGCRPETATHSAALLAPKSSAPPEIAF